jgi:Protein of unknown function (DUF3631)
MISKMSQEDIKAAADRAEARSKGETTSPSSAGKEFVKTSLDEGELNKEISKLAALPIGVYETRRVEEARRLGVRATALDMLVKAARPKTTKKPDNFLPHWNVEPWPESVNGVVLLSDIRKHLKNYVVLSSQHAETAIALWILHTWVFDAFDITPYLAITSPSRRCGKSLLMTILYWLCSRAKKNDSMSKAAIYRSVEADRPTLVLDEVSWVLDLKDERQGILCGGFERLGHVEVCEGEGNDIGVKRFSTYCPKAFGLIGKLTATLMDRSIEIKMQRKLKEKVFRLRRRDNEQHEELRRKCLRWTEDNKEKLKGANPKLPEGLNDRAIDVWEPLFAIAELAGDVWPKLAIEAAKALSGGESGAEENGIELLRDLKAEFDVIGKPAITTKTLIAKLCADEEKPWATYAPSGKPITNRQLAKLLAPFEIVSDIVHPNQTGEPRAAKGYKRSHCQDAFERYLTPTESAQKAPASQDQRSQAYRSTSADETGTSSDFSVRTETDLYGSEKCQKPANDGDLYGCTDKNAPSGNGHDPGTSKSDVDDAFEDIPSFLDRRGESASTLGLRPRQSGSLNGGSRPFRTDVEDAYAELAEREADSTSDCVCAHCGKPADGTPIVGGFRLHDRCLTAWTRRQAKLRAGGISETRGNGLDVPDATRTQQSTPDDLSIPGFEEIDG